MAHKNLAIMFTDIKGFTDKTTKSTREDLHRLIDTHDKIARPIFRKHKGTVIKTIGDAFLVTFESPTNAVLCGIALQNAFDAHNSKSEKHDRIELRIAINSGEVTIKNNDIFGDAVNTASRIEKISAPGCVYFSESVYLAMNRKEIRSSEIGYRKFKGVEDPVRIYRVVRDGEKHSSKKAKVAAIVLILLVILAAVLLIKSGQDDKFDTAAKAAEEGLLQHNMTLVYDSLQAMHKLSDRRNNPKDMELKIERIESRAATVLVKDAEAIASDARIAIQKADYPLAEQSLKEMQALNDDWQNPQVGEMILKLKSDLNLGLDKIIRELNIALMEKNSTKFYYLLDKLREYNSQYNNPDIALKIKSYEQKGKNMFA